MMELATARARIHLDRSAIRRMMGFGALWGLAMTIGITALQATTCGAICLSDVAITGGLSTVAGIPTIGALAAFYPKQAS